MSAKVLGLVLEHFPARDAQELAVALVLADAADHDGSHVFPSVARVARFARTSERTVQRALSAFRESGFLRVIFAGGGRNRPAQYEIDLLWLLAQPSVLEPAGGKGDCESPFTKRVTRTEKTTKNRGQIGKETVTKPRQSCVTQPVDPVIKQQQRCCSADGFDEQGKKATTDSADTVAVAEDVLARESASRKEYDMRPAWVPANCPAGWLADLIAEYDAQQPEAPAAWASVVVKSWLSKKQPSFSRRRKQYEAEKRKAVEAAARRAQDDDARRKAEQERKAEAAFAATPEGRAARRANAERLGELRKLLKCSAPLPA